jgi:predicted NUDIX family NTP pyrophosphohydrolase
MSSKTNSRARVSAGIVVYRWKEGFLEVLIAHPGGPFFARRDEGYWTIPKGEPKVAEDLVEAAVREFKEEVGFKPMGPFIDLGSIQQKGGKVVYAWACEGDLPNGHVHQCNTFRMEWPLNSGKFQSFPEIDKACFFPVSEARRKLKEAQVPLVDRLLQKIQEYRRD